LPIDLAGESALGPEAETSVLHALVPDLGMVFVGTDFERHEVAQIATSGLLEFGEDVVGRAGHAQVEILRGPCAREPELEHETTFKHGCVSEHGDEAREEAIEDEELALACELGATSGTRAQALLERLLECHGRGIGTHRHAARPPNGLSAFLTSPSSALVTRPRRRACCAPWRRRSGESPSRAQSLSEREALVAGVGPNQARSCGDTSA
jgi:hypothetical protein